MAHLWPMEPRLRQAPSWFFRIPGASEGHELECIADHRAMLERDPGDGMMWWTLANCQAASGDGTGLRASLLALHKLLGSHLAAHLEAVPPPPTHPAERSTSP